jgi:hypothetical protein
MCGTMLVLSCASPSEPVPTDGRIVVRLENGSPANQFEGGTFLAAATFDSMIVRVFRGGTAIIPETARGVALNGGGPVEVSLSCVAENHKRVSIELFNKRVMTYHGANTNVNVLAGQHNSVPVDAHEFMVDTLVIAPQAVVQEGTMFMLRWNAARAATSYLVQSSATPDFTTIEWEQSVTDTVLGHQDAAGSHYFRVVPKTPFASGPAAGPRLGYVIGGGDKVNVTALVPSRVIPGELFTIVGENLDYPGTTAVIGSDNMEIVQASWDSLVVRLPRGGRTNNVTVTSGNAALQSDVSPAPLVALRVAYVTANGGFAAEYVAELEKRNDDFDNSGVAVVPVDALDTRDMNAFDIIVVAHDTGTLPVNWGADNPARASAIANSRANVLAIGRGGAVFLALVVPGSNYPTTSTVDGDRKYYARDNSAVIFTTPHDIATPDVGIFDVPAATIAFTIQSPYPSSVNLYASTGKNCLVICTPDDQWAMMDFRHLNTAGSPVIYFFFGFHGAPAELNAEGSEILGNVMYLLNGSP